MLRVVKNGSFSRLFWDFHFWTFLKMSNFQNPIDFSENSCYHKKQVKNARKNVMLYGKTTKRHIETLFFEF
jgi:hypothetical protein